MAGRASSGPQTLANPADPATSGSPAPQLLQDQAQRLIRRNAYWALGLGLIPIPFVDLLSLTAVQVKLIKEISDLYGVDFATDKARLVISSLIAGLGSVSLTALVARSLFKLVPVIGQVVGVIGEPVLAGALTSAVGNVFVMHYESGGTLLDFDAEKMRDYFRTEFVKAKQSLQKSQTDRPVDSRERRAP